jgi:DNA-binding XRE family transcriptional regulator
MRKPKPIEEKEQARQERATEWRDFMKNHLFTEKRLAETIGISRRTVQMVRAGKVTPHDNTLRLFVALKAKYDREGK